MDPIEETDKLELEGRVEEAAQRLRSWLGSDQAEPWMLPDLLRLEMLLGRPLKVIEAVAQHGQHTDAETFDRVCDRLIDGLWEVALLDQLKKLQSDYLERIGSSPTSRRIGDLIDPRPKTFADVRKWSTPSQNWSSVPVLLCEAEEACWQLRVTAWNACKAGDFETAKNIVQEALLLSPFDPYLLIFLSFTRRRLGDLDGALEPLDELLRRYPENAEASMSKVKLIRQKEGLWAAVQYGAEMSELMPWLPFGSILIATAYLPKLSWRRLVLDLSACRQARAEARQLGDAAVQVITERMLLKQGTITDPLAQHDNG